MARTKISEFSAVSANNTDIDSINIAEGCAPSGINDAIRELMAQLKDFQTGAQGDSFNGPVGTTTAAAGAFTTLSSTGATTLGDASGDAITINGTATFANANPILSAGTANGVLYLNGSKVATSGSALTFDGSNIGITASSSAGFVGSTIQNTSAGSGASSGLGINNDSTATTYLRTYGSGQTNTLIGSVIANYTALLSDGAASNGILLGTLTNKPIIFGQNNAEAMRLTSTGLGIGTSSPAYKLDVRGTNDQYIQILTSSTGGYAAGLRMKSTGSGEYGVFADSSLRFYDFTASATRLTLDSSGNLGLGVTPSAWGSGSGSWKALETNGGAIWATGSNMSVVQNMYNNGSGYLYKANGYASFYTQTSGQHQWLNAPSGTAGNAITFTQAMTLDASGNFGVGNTTPSAWLYNGISAGSGSSDAGFTAYSGSSNYGAIAFADSSSGTARYAGLIQYFHTNDSMQFYTASTERARIDSSGNLLVAQTSLSITTLGASIQSNGYISCAGSSSTNGNSNYNLYSTGAGAFRFYVGMGGTVYATSTTITGISDQRLKENIRDLDEGLDVVMALKPRKFDWKEGKGADIKNARGFIAQEFETVLPDMIEEWKDPAPEGEEPYKAVNANLIPTLVKAIQELNAKFEAYKASHP